MSLASGSPRGSGVRGGRIRSALGCIRLVQDSRTSWTLPYSSSFSFSRGRSMIETIFCPPPEICTLDYAHQNSGLPLNLDLRVFEGDVGLTGVKIDSPISPQFSQSITLILHFHHNLLGHLTHISSTIFHNFFLPSLSRYTIPRHADVLSVVQLCYVSQQLHLPLRPILAPSCAPNRATDTPFSRSSTPAGTSMYQ